jgi:RNA polymerase sigma factor (sigma-70 family)
MVRIRPGNVQREVKAVFTSGTVAGLSDAELLDRFLGRRDDGASFEALVARHGPMVLGVCRDLLGDEHAADDAFQATFLVLVRKANRVRVGDSLGRWLYGVAHRVARHARADAARRKLKEEAAGSIPDASPGADFERADLRAVLHEELARLPETFRTPVVLCHLEGLTHEEAARQLRCPVGTVRSRLARGRDRLRGRLVRRGVAPAAAAAVAALGGSSRAAVPAALVASTASAAARFAGEAGVGAISVSVLTLTKGVLLAMSLGPWKVAATGLIAVGLIAVATTGVIAQQGKPAIAGDSNSSIPDGKKGADPSPAEVLRSALAQWERAERLRQADNQRTAAIRQQIDRAVEALHSDKPDEALRSLERARSIASEITQDEDRPGATPLGLRRSLEDVSRKATPAALAPAALPAPAPSPRPAPAPNPKVNSFTTPPPLPSPVTDDSSQELMTEYRSAQESFKRLEQLYRQGASPSSEVSAGRERLDRARNRIESRADFYRDQLELLQLQLKRQQAEVDRVKGQRDLAVAQVATHERLGGRQKGLVSHEEMEKSEGELVVANAALRAAEADREIIELRIRQFERRRVPVVQFLESLPKPPTADRSGPGN